MSMKTHMGRVKEEELNITNVRDFKRTTKRLEGVCPFTNIIKDHPAKAKSLGIKCVSLLDMNFGGFSSAKLSDISRIER